MKNQKVYQQLEDKMLKYSDLIDIPVKPNKDKLVPIEKSSYLMINPIDRDMFQYTGEDIYVRETVSKKLRKVSELLSEYSSELQLEVVYGYRALKIQQKLFLKYKRRLEEELQGNELLEAVHRLIAVPEIAGHPTGGAVDLQIVKNGKAIDMGTRIWEFSKDSFTFSPFISKKAKQNRQLLRSLMLKVGFAPFDGEWWHFSYGDKEWAKYYAKPYAIYEQVNFKL